jgi:tRNA nucleotidyltransferase/poly(A) polymerase
MKKVLEAQKLELDLQVGALAHKFDGAGYKFYLVGGVVRDLLLGKLNNDIDVTTDAEPDVIVKLVTGWADAIWDQGAKFGTIGVRKNSQIIEITTHRSENYVSDSRKPSVQFSQVIEDDLSRRDFTVNSIAIKIPEWELIDPFGGQLDLERKVLRTPLDPEVSFGDDPLRMLRAARFMAGYQLVPGVDLIDAVELLRERISIVSKERVIEELKKLLKVEAPTKGLLFLEQTGLLGLVIEGYDGFVSVPELDVNDFSDELSLSWAILLYPIVTSGEQARVLLVDMRASKNLAKKVGRVIEATHQISSIDEATEPNVRRILFLWGDEVPEALAVLKALKKNPSQNLLGVFTRIIESEGNRGAQSPLDGNEIMGLVGDGPIVGRAINFLNALIFQVGLISREEAIKAVEDWSSSQKN